MRLQLTVSHIWDTLHDLIPFVQLKKFLNCTNGTKPRNAQHMCLQIAICFASEMYACKTVKSTWLIDESSEANLF